METERLALLLILCFKLATLICGSFIIYMGYRLFQAGLLGDAGEVDGRAGRYQLIVRRAAPGTFFALFGAVIIVVSVSIGFSVTLGAQGVSAGESAAALPDAPPIASAAGPKLPLTPPVTSTQK